MTSHSRGIKNKKKALKKNAFERDLSELRPLKSLGEKTSYVFNYTSKILETIPNKNPSQIAWTSFVCSEFTTLCPKTGQPDYAKIFFNYIADQSLVESKSLKLYLMSYRQSGHFHEDCIQMMCNDLVKILHPKYLEVIGEFTPRGGISIFPYSNYSNKEKFFIELKNRRLFEYSPGKYSVDLSKLYK